MDLPSPLRGIVPPLVTPLSGPDSLDYEGFERLIGRVVKAGCTGVFVLGSTGEAQALSYSLRLEVVREACRIVAGRVPVLAGISDTSIAESVRLGKAAVEAGAAALVTTPPFYFRLSQSDLLRHAAILAEELPVPLFLYNMPGLTKLAYAPDTVAAAAKIPGIIGLKDSSGDLFYLQRVIRALGENSNFSVLVGPEEILPQAISLGAHGGVTGGANLRPELYVELYNASVQGRTEIIEPVQRRVLDLSEGIYTLGDPATSYIRGLKCALGIDGICSPLPAPPMVEFSEPERAMIADRLKQHSNSAAVWI